MDNLSAIGLIDACKTERVSSNNGNIPANVPDNNFETRWSANGGVYVLILKTGDKLYVSKIVKQ